MTKKKQIKITSTGSNGLKNKTLVRVDSPNRSITRIKTATGIKGDTGKSAFQTALDGGFVGSKEEWLESLVGKNAYQLALDHGFVGTEQEWFESLIGLSSYEVALDNGFVGTEPEWLESLKGKSAYQIAVDQGFQGTEEEWIVSIGGAPLINISTAGFVLSNDGSSLFWRAVNMSDIDGLVDALNAKMDEIDFPALFDQYIRNFDFGEMQ